MKRISFLMASLFFASSTYAGNFEGLSVFAKAGSQSTDTQLKWTGTGDNVGDSSKTDGNGRSTFVGIIGADYGFKLNEKILTLVGVEFNVNDTTSFKEERVNSRNDGTFTSSGKMKQKNTYGIYIAPGYLINEDALIYAKLSYNRTKLEAKFYDQQDNNTTKLSDNFDGFGFGVGARLNVAKNVFVSAEWQKIQYSSESTNVSGGKVKYEPETTLGTVGIGYNF